MKRLIITGNFYKKYLGETDKSVLPLLLLVPFFIMCFRVVFPSFWVKDLSDVKTTQLAGGSGFSWALHISV